MPTNAQEATEEVALSFVLANATSGSTTNLARGP